MKNLISSNFYMRIGSIKKIMDLKTKKRIKLRIPSVKKLFCSFENRKCYFLIWGQLK